jgi:carnitine 3-dehydrogenase
LLQTSNKADGNAPEEQTFTRIGATSAKCKKNKHVDANDEPEAALWREAIHLVNGGVASVADVDAGIAYGPGLRWAIMGRISSSISPAAWAA